MPKDDHERFASLLGTINVAFTHYFTQAKRKRKNEVLNMMLDSLREFTIRANAEFAPGGCPPGTQRCPDDSCMPPGACRPKGRTRASAVPR